ncbi:MAG: hypothetical protein KBD60_10105 [Sterolibacterium sp.]|nr:hypothetical protein [Sterolibacterium sp.]
MNRCWIIRGGTPEIEAKAEAEIEDDFRQGRFFGFVLAWRDDMLCARVDICLVHGNIVAHALGLHHGWADHETEAQNTKQQGRKQALGGQESRGPRGSVEEEVHLSEAVMERQFRVATF